MSSTQDLDAWLNILTEVQSQKFSTATKDLYPWSDNGPPATGEPWQLAGEHRAFILENQRLLQTARRLAQADIKRRMPVTIDGLNTELKWSEGVRGLAHLFQLQAIEAIYRGDSQEAASAILSLLGCARSVEAQPLLISQLVSITVESAAIEELQKAVQQNVLSEADLTEILKRLRARTAWQTLWQVGLISERAAILPAFKEPARYLGEDYQKNMMSVPWRARDELNYLNICEEWLSVPQDDLPNFFQICRRQDQQLTNQLRSSNLTNMFDNLLSRYLTPAYGAYAKPLSSVKCVINWPS